MKNTVKAILVLMLTLVTLMGGVAVAEKAEGKNAFNGSVKIVMTNGKDLSFGDEVTLKAVVKGAGDTEYTLRWEVKEGKKWKAIGETDSTYSFIVTEENQNYKYRVAVETEA